MAELVKGEAAELARVEKEEPYKLVDIIHMVLGVGMVLFQLVSTYHVFQGTTGQQNVHLMLALVIVFLSAYRKAQRFRWVFLALIALSLVPTVYIQLFLKQLEFLFSLFELIYHAMSLILLSARPASFRTSLLGSSF